MIRKRCLWSRHKEGSKNRWLQCQPLRGPEIQLYVALSMERQQSSHSLPLEPELDLQLMKCPSAIQKPVSPGIHVRQQRFFLLGTEAPSQEPQMGSQQVASTTLSSTRVCYLRSPSSPPCQATQADTPWNRGKPFYWILAKSQNQELTEWLHLFLKHYMSRWLFCRNR